MRDAGYGRIVNTTSGGMFGQENLSIYGTAKGGIFGLTRSLAIEGAAHKIKVNALGPAANTTAMNHLNEACAFNTMMEEHFPVDLVSPAAAYLAHGECEVSGVYLEVGGGNVATRVFGINAGFHDVALTIEAVRDNLATIVDKSTTAIIPDFWEAAPGTGEAAQLGIIPKPYKAG
jgi:short-subunit dehydrogenase